MPLGLKMLTTLRVIPALPWVTGGNSARHQPGHARRWVTLRVINPVGRGMLPLLVAVLMDPPACPALSDRFVTF